MHVRASNAQSVAAVYSLYEAVSSYGASKQQLLAAGTAIALHGASISTCAPAVAQSMVCSMADRTVYAALDCGDLNVTFQLAVVGCACHCRLPAE